VKRRIVVIGRTGLAVACLRIVMEAGDDVAAVVVDRDDDGIDGWQPSLRRAAAGAGVKVMQPGNVNEPSVVDELAAASPHFLLSFQAAPILRAPLISIATVAALNLHYGLLPRYRGVAPIAWAVINGEAETGVTLHHIDDGIDSGPIVASDRVAIGPSDTAREVYDRCLEAGVRLFSAQWPVLRELNNVPGTAQDSDSALYYNRHALDFGVRRIRWEADAQSLADWMRAFIFPPFQYPELMAGDRTFGVAEFEWDRLAHSGRPGQVLALSERGLVIAVPGGRIVVKRLIDGSEPVAPADIPVPFAIGQILEGAR
jgi:methionyl-tRNA formyltransferase